MLNDRIGFRDNTYQPDLEVMRGELLVILMDTLDIEVSESEVVIFSDVPSGSLYRAYVDTGYELGVVEGYDDGTCYLFCYFT